MGFDINSFILNRPFLNHLKDFSQILAKPDISFFCGGTLNHFLVVGKHSICMEVATFLFVRPFGVLRYPCIISPSMTFRSTPLDSHIPVLFWNVLNGYTDTRHTYMAPTYLPGALPTISMVHGSIFQTTQAKAAKVHWLILIRCNRWGWVLLDISTLKIPISLHPHSMQFPQLNRSFWIVQAPDSKTWSHDGYTNKLDQIVPNITLYCQYMPISYHQWTSNKIQKKLTSTIETPWLNISQNQGIISGQTSGGIDSSITVVCGYGPTCLMIGVQWRMTGFAYGGNMEKLEKHQMKQ